MRFYVKSQLSPKRELTHQGYLLCRDVPIARTGQQIYGPDETPIEVGPDGRAIVEREETEVFRPETMQSFNGVPLTNNHPEDDVTPLNWKELALGTVFNVRRGSGVESELLLADILVTDVEAIRLIVEEGKDELSCGYDCKYEETGIGTGRQVEIVGNHVALVDAGRCGWECSVRDSAAKILGGSKMAKQTITFKSGWASVKDSLAKKIAALSTKDEESVKKILDAAEAEEEKEEKAKDAKEDEDGDNHIHIHTGEKTDDSARDARLDKIEDSIAKMSDAIASMAKDKAKDAESEEEKEKAKDAEKEEADKAKDDFEEEAPEGTGDEARSAKDSAYFEDSFQSTISNAEILAPGIAFPTFDRAAAPKSTLDSLTGFRRKVLGIASSTTAGAVIVSELRAGRTLTHDALTKMKPAEVRTLFNGAALAMKQRNAAAETSVSATRDSSSKSKSLNEINKAFWAGK